MYNDYTTNKTNQPHIIPLTVAEISNMEDIIVSSAEMERIANKTIKDNSVYGHIAYTSTPLTTNQQNHKSSSNRKRVASGVSSSASKSSDDYYSRCSNSLAMLAALVAIVLR